MAALNIQVNNLDAVLKKIDGVQSRFAGAAQNELNAWANETATLAKQKVPVDEGHLRGSINANLSNWNAGATVLTAGVTVAVFYAAYVEFGTKTFAAPYVSILPADWQSFAAGFKGKGGGGSFMSFFYKILKWVQRKGFAAKKTKSGKRSNSKSSIQEEYDVAYRITLTIMKKGMKAQPFLFPAYVKTVSELKKNLKNLVK